MKETIKTMCRLSESDKKSIKKKYFSITPQVCGCKYFGMILRSDGTTEIINTAGNEIDYDKDSWSNITRLYAGEGHIAGLRADGTVVAVGDNSRGQCETSEWNNIIDISAGNGYTMGLTSDEKYFIAGGFESIDHESDESEVEISEVPENIQKSEIKENTEKSKISVTEETKIEYTPVDNFEYKYNYDDTVTITKYVGNFTEVNIPPKIGGRMVATIGVYAFNGCTSLTNITIPDSVTSIGRNAFRGCSSLTNIIIPNSVTSIGHGAFYGCSSLTNVIIPDSVTYIGYDAFCFCISLTNIIIPDSNASIGGGAFRSCSSLKNITIPKSVAKMGSYVFSGCLSLKTIYIKGKKSRPSSWDLGWYYDIYSDPINAQIIWNA